MIADNVTSLGKTLLEATIVSKNYPFESLVESILDGFKRKTFGVKSGATNEL